MRVRGTDQAELVRVGTKFCLELEAVFKCFASILVLQHTILFHHCEVQVAKCQRFVVGKLIIRREQRMCFAVAFNLSDFVERLPEGALRCIIPLPIGLKPYNIIEQ